MQSTQGGKLKPRSLARADEIVELGFKRPSIEYAVQGPVEQPVVAASVSVWRSVLEGTPRLPHERFFPETSPNGRARTASGAQP